MNVWPLGVIVAPTFKETLHLMSRALIAFWKREREIHKSRRADNASKHSRFANLVIVNFVVAVRTGGDEMKFLSA